MPYIKQSQRPKFNKDIKSIVENLKKSANIDNQVCMGEVNYVISSIIWELFRSNVSYSNGNNLIGVLECAKLEFYRRQLGTYEDVKILENEDI